MKRKYACLQILGSSAKYLNCLMNCDRGGSVPAQIRPGNTRTYGGLILLWRASLGSTAIVLLTLSDSQVSPTEFFLLGLPADIPHGRLPD